MKTVMTAQQLAERCRQAAQNYQTLYVMGCFGAPLTESNKQRYTQNHSYNRQPARAAMIRAASGDVFGFDCVCLIKGLLWGWSGKTEALYGGASYAANGVPDVSADGMISLCEGLSTNFSALERGEALWLSGHIGVYIGDGLAVECTPKWKNGVQITAVGNLGTGSGYPARTWSKHGRLPWVDYGAQTPSEARAVTWARQLGLIGEDFAPDEPCSRAELLRLLYQLHGKA